MDRVTEVALAEELLELQASKSAFLDPEVKSSPVEHYFDKSRFEQEHAYIFRTTTQPIVHSSELAEPGAFIRRNLAGLPILFTRDAEGVAHAFLNVCRHRGTRLVDAHSGCKRRFSCPYHAWTWDNQGKLVGVPHEAQGFPGIDKKAMGLKRIACVERNGWLWANASETESPDVASWLAGLDDDLVWFSSADHRVVYSDELLCNANWKILVEGGIEAYHFRVAHRDTIAPFFCDNLSSYQQFGPHLRSILAKRTLTELRDQPQDYWQIRDHAQVLYGIFPLNQWLVQSDHFVWVQSEPLHAQQTRIRISTLAPADNTQSDEDLEHWRKNHQITMDTLTEDFTIGESIQSGLQTGANDELTFGRFEGALAAFNQCIDETLSRADCSQ
ncbi:MAG: SRPBCC family protein [Pseudomonadota bacterium]